MNNTSNIPIIPLTLAEERKFQQAKTCHMCLSEDRVRDHCHILGHFHGAAQNHCNLNYRIKPNSWKLPVLFHNLRGYDGHLIVKTLKKKNGKTRVIANNLEIYMSFSADQLQFLDSFQFTNVARKIGRDTHLQIRNTYLPNYCLDPINLLHHSWISMECCTQNVKGYVATYNRH